MCLVPWQKVCNENSFWEQIIHWNPEREEPRALPPEHYSKVALALPAWCSAYPGGRCAGQGRAGMGVLCWAPPVSPVSDPPLLLSTMSVSPVSLAARSWVSSHLGQNLSLISCWVWEGFQRNWTPLACVFRINIVCSLGHPFVFITCLLTWSLLECVAFQTISWQRGVFLPQSH